MLLSELNQLTQFLDASMYDQTKFKSRQAKSSALEEQSMSDVGWSNKWFESIFNFKRN